MTDDQAPPPIWDWHLRRRLEPDLKHDPLEVTDNGILWRLAPWDVRREGRAWDEAEIEIKYLRFMQEIKDELIDGRIFWHHATRMMVLGLMLENVGIDNALEFGNLDDWQAAIDAKRAAL